MNFVQSKKRINSDFNPYLTEQPFTKSDNYGRSTSVQRFLKEKIYKHYDWSGLLRLH